MLTQSKLEKFIKESSAYVGTMGIKVIKRDSTGYFINTVDGLKQVTETEWHKANLRATGNCKAKINYDATEYDVRRPFDKLAQQAEDLEARRNGEMLYQRGDSGFRRAYNQREAYNKAFREV